MYRIGTFALTIAVLTTIAGAQAPSIINHQGRIAVGGVNFDGTGYFKFALIRFSNVLWSNDGTTGVDAVPGVAVPVAVANGHYAVPLGDTGFHANMNNPIPPDILGQSSNLALRIWFSATGAPGSSERLFPDRKLTSAPYALVASMAEGIVDDLDMGDDEVVGVRRLGIGTNDPQTEFHLRTEDLSLGPLIPLINDILVEGASASLGLFSRPSLGPPSIYLGESDDGAITYWRIQKRASDDTIVNSNALALWWTQANGTGILRFVFDESGRFGIGTGAPQADLHVWRGSNPLLKLQSNTDALSGRVSLRDSDETGIDLYYDGTSAIEGLRVDPYDAGTAAPTALFVSNKGADRGNVGIGTTAPQSPLHVIGTARVQGVINAGSGTQSPRAYNSIANNVASVPQSGDITNSIDLYISGDLEARRIYGSLQTPSDRDIKRDIAPVDPAAVLDKVAALPISTWHYKSDELGSRHIGPMAQDFSKAFELGHSDKSIATVDADGVALAAIQALKSENDALRQRLENLEDLVARLSEKLEP